MFVEGRESPDYYRVDNRAKQISWCISRHASVWRRERKTWQSLEASSETRQKEEEGIFVYAQEDLEAASRIAERRASGGGRKLG